MIVIIQKKGAKVKLFKNFIASAVLISASVFGCKAQEPLETVAYVDVERYMGKWYEVAAFPQNFEKDCTGTTAEYTLLSDGKVKIINSCHLNTLDGKLKVANGSAYVADTETNAKLKVTFFKPFYGDYWILDLGADYEYAMVGSPDRDYLWFLSRTPNMHENTFEHLKQKAYDLGFNTSALEVTLQPTQG